MTTINQLYSRIIDAMGVEGLEIPMTAVKFYKKEDEIPAPVKENQPSISLTSCQATKQVKPTVLIYDAKCSLCCGCMNWIKSHAMGTDTFEFIACQSEERKSRFPDIREEACLEALHLVTPDGLILAGDKSLPEILCNLRYFRWLTIFFKMPVISLLSYFVYRRIADNRYIISQTILPLTREEA